MKRGTGKPKTIKKRKPLKPIVLAPLDVNGRYPPRYASAFLHQSDPTTFKQIKNGVLESFKVGRRRYITGRSIAANSLPPGNRKTSDGKHVRSRNVDRTAAHADA